MNATPVAPQRRISIRQIELDMLDRIIAHPFDKRDFGAAVLDLPETGETGCDFGPLSLPIGARCGFSDW